MKVNTYLSIVRISFILPFICFFYNCTSNTIDEEFYLPEKADNTVGGCTYYWYDGEKVHLNIENDKNFIVYNSFGNDGNSDFIRSGDMDASLRPDKTTRSFYSQKLKWGVTKKNSQSLTRAISEDVLYVSPLYTDKEGTEYIASNLVYVKLKEEKDTTLLFSLAKQYRTSVQDKNPYLENWYTLICTNNSLGNSIVVANKLYETGSFEYAEPDIFPSKKDLICSYNDPFYNNQWNLHGNYSTNWEAASKITQGKGVTICVIDQGVDALHPDFSNNVSVGFDANYEDPWGAGNIYGPHGMYCVGIIGAKPNNRIGVVGMASEATIYSFSDPLEASPNSIQHLASDLSVAISSSDVVSCSWGSEAFKSSMIKSVIYKARWARNNKGTVLVFASGNSYGSVAYPANCDENIIAVGGMNQYGRRASYSNYGKELSVVAPSENISTLCLKERKKRNDNLYDYVTDFSKTSAACPQVAAIAALVLSVNPNLTREEVKSIIERTARKLQGYNFISLAEHPNGTWNEEVGYGLIDAYAAVQEAIKLKN